MGLQIEKRLNWDLTQMMQGPLLQKITHVSERITEEMQDYMKTT